MKKIIISVLFMGITQYTFGVENSHLTAFLSKAALTHNKSKPDLILKHGQFEQLNSILQFKQICRIDTHSIGAVVCHNQFDSIVSKEDWYYGTPVSTRESFTKNLSLGLLGFKGYKEQKPTLITQVRDGMMLATLRYLSGIIINNFIHFNNISVIPREVDKQKQLTLLDFLDTTIVSPICEELIFTHLPHKLLGKSAKFISPFLFGLAHYNSDPTSYALYVGVTGFSNFLRTVYLEKNPNHILTPSIAHIAHNVRGCYQTKSIKLAYEK